MAKLVAILDKFHGLFLEIDLLVRAKWNPGTTASDDEEFLRVTIICVLAFLNGGEDGDVVDG